MNKKEQNKTICPACGNNPTNHTRAYIHNTLTVFMEPIVLGMYRNIVIRTLIERSIDVFNWFAIYIYIPLFKFIGLVSWNTDKTKAVSMRSRVVWDEAEKRNIPMEQLVILNRPLELYRARIQGKKILFESIPHRNTKNKQSDLWMDDKFILKEKLKSKKIPVPDGKSVTSYEEAKEVFKNLTKPVIIKPRLGSRGRHTSTFIYNEDILKSAFESARELCRYVIIEEHLIGSVYRGTAVNEKIVGILRGDPPRIIGNGKDTIKKLIEEKNKTRLANVSEIHLDDRVNDFLQKQGFSLKTILEKDISIDISEKIGVSYGGSSEEIFTQTHVKIIQALEQAAKVVDGEIIGFDFIIPDPTRDPDTQKWGIIECNSLPFINLHHTPLHGTPVNVAAKVWDLWNEEGKN